MAEILYLTAKIIMTGTPAVDEYQRRTLSLFFVIYMTAIAGPEIRHNGPSLFSYKRTNPYVHYYVFTPKKQCRLDKSYHLSKM